MAAAAPPRRRLGPPSLRRAASNGPLGDAAADRALPVATDGDPSKETALDSDHWTFWGRGQRPPERGSKNAWASEPLHKIRTAEAFFRLHGALEKPSTLGNGATYQLFRNDVEPTWEDPSNANGGEWSIPLERSADLDDQWKRLCLAAIGGQLTPSADDADLDEVCGCSLSLKKGGSLRLGVWTKHRTDEVSQRAVAENIRRVLNLQKEVALTYAPHDSKGDALYTS